MSTAELLKEEGNKLFVKKRFPAAEIKYTEAIALDGKNAILYANRAACRLSLKRFLDAKDDAKEATKLDPNYAKAWGRLASAHDALTEFSSSIHAWERALQCFPKENLSPAQISQQQEYQAALDTAKRGDEQLRRLAQGMPANAYASSLSGMDITPWGIAERMVPELAAKGQVESCAYVLWGAFKDFREGVQEMKSIKFVQTDEGKGYITGHIGGLTSLSNAILRDNRVFYVDGPDWMEAFDNQVRLIDEMYGTWLKAGPQRIMEEALARQRKDGWDDVRRALSATIRMWILHGFVSFRVHDERTNAGVEFLGRALEIIGWGRTVWKNVSRTDRGTIFDDTFHRGVQNLYMVALLEAYGKDNSNTNALETLYNEANEVILDVEANPYNRAKFADVDTGFQFSFWLYPKATAYASIGFYHAQEARKLEENNGNMGDITERFILAGKSYLNAADHLPSDDEDHPWFLRCSLVYLGPWGVPVNSMLKTMERIQTSLLKVQRIWNQNPNRGVGSQKQSSYELIAQEEKKLRKQLAQGKVTADEMVSIRLN